METLQNWVKLVKAYFISKVQTGNDLDTNTVHLPGWGGQKE